ncbi:inducible mutagenesis protein A [Roseibium denhamense]|uniref:ImuA family protein n=1 Tax=Roseibium denhamense TaxID=76305 RepID=UPI0012BCE85A|nr:inducible mutagenesis protein A [Roseibium denhamense]MTI07324.1 inducible mutagenesis protein A [Roseibium denhamense]
MIGTSVHDAAQKRIKHSTSVAELRRRIADLEGRLPSETQFAPAPAPAANPQGPDIFQSPRPGDANQTAQMDNTARSPLGLAELDDLFASGQGLKHGALHEVVSAESRQAGALSGFAFALLARLLKDRTGPVVIVQDPRALREAGQLHGPGLLAYGIDPARLVIVRPRRMEDLLWSLEEAAGCPALAAALGEVQGPHRLLDLTATRRLALRAERSQAPVFLLRHGAEREPTAALTRWQVSPNVSAPPDLIKYGPHQGLGVSAWRIELTRNRDGRSGHETVEWRHAERKLAAPAHSLDLVRGSARRPDSAPVEDRLIPFRARS